MRLDDRTPPVIERVDDVTFRRHYSRDRPRVGAGMIPNRNLPRVVVIGEPVREDEAGRVFRRFRVDSSGERRILRMTIDHTSPRPFG